MINKYYLCDSDSVLDIAAWETAFTKSDRVRITKADLIESIDLFKAVQGAQTATGNTWSQKLLRDNAPAKWITFRGNRVLIKLNSDGTGRVVFSANPSFEHLRIIPKTHEEYKKIKEDKEKNEAKRKEKEGVTEEQIQKERQAKKDIKVKRIEVKEAFRKKLSDVLEVSKEAIADVEKKLVAKADKLLGREKEKELAELYGIVTDAKEAMPENKKKLVDKALVEAAERKLHDEALGNEMVSDELSTEVGDKKVDEAIKAMRQKMTLDQAIEIVNAKATKKAYEKEIREYYKDELVTPTGNLEITSLQGIGILDFDSPIEGAKDKAVEAALKSIEAQNRAMQNTQFYQAYEDREGKSGTVKSLTAGSKDTINAMAGMYLEGASLSREAIEFIGTENASRVIANSISENINDAKFVRDMEKLIQKRSQAVVKEVLGQVQDKKERINDYTDQKMDGMLAASTGAAAIAREYGAMGQALGFAVGSLETSANVLDSMRGIDDAGGDIVVDGGKNYDALKKKLSDLGLTEDDYNIKRNKGGDRSGRYDAIIYKESQNKMLSDTTASNQRDKFVEDLKTGELHDPNYYPAGADRNVMDFVSKEMYDAKKEKYDKKGYKPYENKKGEKGYSSEYPQGTTLYGKEVDNLPWFTAQRQRLIKYALGQKRVVWNAGAGTGKTFSYLAVASTLKQEGKLDKSFALVSPPSRLRKEFLKDTEKFYGHLNTVILDDVKKEHKQEVLDYASKGERHPKYGKIDVLITGHDSIKSGTSKGDINSYINSQKEAHIEETRNNESLSNEQKLDVKTSDYWKKGKGVELVEQWKKDASDNVGLAAMIKNANPTYVAVDEAHEAFKGESETESQRFSAIKKVYENAEYVVSGTGTVVKNNIAELGNILHLTKPEEIPSASKFSNKYKGINQNTGVFQSEATHGMAKDYDNVMITEKLKIKPKEISNRVKVKLNDYHKEQYSKSEEMYRMDRDSVGFGIVNKETGELMMSGGGLHNFSEIPFSMATDEIKNQSAAHKEFLSKQGYDHNKYSVAKLGRGAAKRRDIRHEKNLNGGDYRKNAKAQEMMKRIESHKGEKQSLVYTHSWSKKTLTDMLKGMGYKENEIAFVDGSIKGAKRDKMVTDFQKDPNVKFMVMNEAGLTGLNMQSGTVQHWMTRPPTYAKQGQGVARHLRSGQDKNVSTYFYDTNTIIDNRKYDNVMRKKKLTEAVQETVGDEGKRKAKGIK